MNSHCGLRDPALEQARVAEAAALTKCRRMGKRNAAVIKLAASGTINRTPDSIATRDDIILRSGCRRTLPVQYAPEKVGLESVKDIDNTVDLQKCKNPIALGGTNIRPSFYIHRAWKQVPRSQSEMRSLVSLRPPNWQGIPHQAQEGVML